MTSIRACTCSGACRADRACDGLPRFQAHLDAAQDGQHPRIHMKTEACASHLGTMVAAMAARSVHRGGSCMGTIAVGPRDDDA